MKKTITLAAVVLAGPAAAAAGHGGGGVSTTAYCLQGRMADGTFTRPRSAASNTLRLGTKITLNAPGPGGLRRYVIRDRIGHGTSLDLWTGSCAEARRFGRRSRSFRIGWS